MANQREKYIELVKDLINEKELFCSGDIVSEKIKFFKLKDPKNNEVSVLRTSIKDKKKNNNNNNNNDIFGSIKKTSNLIKLTEIKKTTTSKIDQVTTRDDRIENSKNQCILF
jgi:hypothetical protein